jgi:hypothetical protein
MTRGGHPDWGLVVGLTIPHRKNKLDYRHKKRKLFGYVFSVRLTVRYYYQNESLV